jgi:hypothetical protein
MKSNGLPFLGTRSSVEMYQDLRKFFKTNRCNRAKTMSFIWRDCDLVCHLGDWDLVLVCVYRYDVLLVLGNSRSLVVVLNGD